MKTYSIFFLLFACLFAHLHTDSASVPENRHITSTWRKYKQKKANKLGQKLINAATDWGASPQEKFLAMKDLLARGANVNYANIMNWRPLQYLLNTSHDPQCIQLLVDAKAHLEGRKRWDKQSKSFKTYETPLQHALKRKHHEVVRILLDAKANPAHCELYDISNYAPEVPLDLLPSLAPYIPGGDESRMCMSRAKRENQNTHDILLNHGIVEYRTSNTAWQKEAQAKLMVAIPAKPLVHLIEDYLYGNLKK